MAKNVLGRFVWYDLMTTDLDAAQAFYTKVIGWGTKQWDGPMPYTMWTHAPEEVPRDVAPEYRHELLLAQGREFDDAGVCQRWQEP